MIIKIFGALIIILSCTGFGFCVNSRNKLKIIELKNMKDCLDIMEREMCVSFKPLFEAVDNIIDKSFKTNNYIFNEILKCRDNNETISLSEKMKCIINNSNKLYDSKDIEILMGLSGIVGCENGEILKNSFEKLKLELDNRISEISENIKNKAIVEKLAVYIGIIIVVFFI